MARDVARRFLFVLPDAGGNAPPTAALAGRLAQRGHLVRVLGHRSLQARFEAVGCRFTAFRRAPDNDTSSPRTDLVKDWEVRSPLAQFARVRDRLLFGPALAFARDVLEEIDRHDTDVAVVDVMLPGAALGAERAAVPTAVLVHTIYLIPAPGIPPIGLGLRPAAGPLGAARDRAIGGLSLRVMATGLPRLNEARAALGLRPLAYTFDQLLAVDRVLVLTNRRFDFPARSLPPSVRYVGPQFEDEDRPRWDPPWTVNGSEPLVLVSLSSTFQDQAPTIRAIMAALDGLAVRALVTLGPTLDPATSTRRPTWSCSPSSPTRPCSPPPGWW